MHFGFERHSTDKAQDYPASQGNDQTQVRPVADESDG
jgi:hypothetical protein